MIAFVLLGTGPILIGRHPRLNGYIVHGFFMLFFHAIGAMLVTIAIQQTGVAKFVLLLVAIDFFAGIPLFIYFAHRHQQGSGHALEQLQQELLMMSQTRLIFPLVVFLGYPHSHTVMFTGRRWLKNPRFSAGFARLILTDRHLAAHWRGLRTLIIQIRRTDIESVTLLSEGLLEVCFRDRVISEATHLLAYSGRPQAQPDRIWLSLGKNAAVWFDALTS